MKVRVVAYGTFRRYLNDREDAEVLLEDGATMDALFQALKKPRRETWMVSVNGKIANEKKVLGNGT